jgi:hypothetical protein
MIFEYMQVKFYRTDKFQLAKFEKGKKFSF